MYRIPFNRSVIAGRELEYVRQAVASGCLGGDGEFSQRCVESLEAMLPGSRVILTSTCTAALEIAGLAAGIGEGDEVILPSFTYVSTANAFARLGAIPVFVDIRPDTLNLDPEQLENALSERTRAIVAVHYGGLPGEMAAYQEFAKRHGLWLFEDAAAALGSAFQAQAAGTLGDFAALSFHETKNINCGQGGALVVNRPELLEQAQVIRDRGTDRQAFREKRVAAYGWQRVGSAYAMSELAAAYLLGQLEMRDRIQEHRKVLFQRYTGRLAPLLATGRIETLHIPAACRSNHHLFPLILDSHASRERLRARFEAAGICSTFHYQPLHLSPMGRRIGRCPAPLPVTESISARLLRLPLFQDLKEEEIDEITSLVEIFLESSPSGEPPVRPRVSRLPVT